MSKSNEEEVATYADFEETVVMFDTRGDKKIYANQIGEVCRALGQNPTEQQIKKLANFPNPDARVSAEVVYPIYQAICKNPIVATEKELCEGIKVFDKEQNGCVSSAELRHVLTSMGEKLTDEEVDQLLSGHEDSQGNINYEEFIRMLLCG